MELRDPVTELKSTVLYLRLSRLNPEYAQRAIDFLSHVAPILATTATHFPFYTRHDAHHGFRVIERVAQAISDQCMQDGAPEALGAPELYLTILAAYAHDLGMTVLPGEADSLRARLGLSADGDWQTHPALQAHLRRQHSRRGGDYIAQHVDLLRVPVPLVDALDRIMRAHNLSVDALETEISSDYAAQERRLDVRQLAIILCVADALEFSETRVVDGVLDAIAADPDPAARTSYLENMKHVCVGDSLAIDGSGRVVVSGTFTDPDVLALAHRTLDEIESWLRGYCDLDRRLSQPRLRIHAEPFSRNLAFRGGHFERLGVRLNTRNVIDLIASNAVWQQNAALAMRELIQNAVEACRYRLHHSSQADSYEPRVSVVFDRARNEITVSDNGCGMSERVILNNLLTIGSSRAIEPGYRDSAYAPLARFGIGFWSVFTLARSARVETAAFELYRGNPAAARAADGIAFDVSLDELKDYTVFRPIIRPCGTTVILEVKNGISIDDVRARARAQLVCSEVSVRFSFDGEDDDLPTSVPAVPPARLIGSRTAILDNYGIELFEWSGRNGTTDLSLLIAYRQVNGRPSFLLEPGKSILGALPTLSFPGAAVCGFVVPLRARNLCIDLLRVGTYLANRTTPRGIEFSLDRTQLILNEASDEFEEEVTDLVHEGYRAFLHHTNGQDLETVAQLRQEAAMHGGNVYDQFTGSELHEAARRFPDLAPIKLHPLSGGGPVYVRPDQLGLLRGTALFVQQWRFDAALPAYIERQLGGARPSTGAAALAAGERHPVYFMEADRVASWLFDADPNSTVQFGPTPNLGQVPIQVVNLGNVDTSRPASVLTEVVGRWTGAVYLREFQGSKPYAFLGRHRVLVLRASKLAARVTDLVQAGRLATLADLVADLSEDEAGYTPPSMQGLV